MAKKKKGRDEIFSDRQAFMKAKINELDSFFKNEVWLYDYKSNAVSKAHFILHTEGKNSTHHPRIQISRCLVWCIDDKCVDVDKIGQRDMILRICQLSSWKMFTSDITTAFLQGKNFAEGPERVIWI